MSPSDLCPVRTQLPVPFPTSPAPCRQEPPQPCRQGHPWGGGPSEVEGTRAPPLQPAEDSQLGKGEVRAEAGPRGRHAHQAHPAPGWPGPSSSLLPPPKTRRGACALGHPEDRTGMFCPALGSRPRQDSPCRSPATYLGQSHQCCGGGEEGHCITLPQRGRERAGPERGQGASRTRPGDEKGGGAQALHLSPAWRLPAPTAGVPQPLSTAPYTP